MVEFSVPGLRVPLRSAIVGTFPLQPEEERVRQMLLPKHASNCTRFADDDPEEVKLVNIMIGVISTGFKQGAFQRRQAIRASLSGALGILPFEARFVIGQVETLEGGWESPFLSGVCTLLEQEVAGLDDILLTRGIDTYLTFPTKVKALMKYAFSSPRQFSHVLKVDDDVFISLALLERGLLKSSQNATRDQPFETIERYNKYRMHGVYTGCSNRVIISPDVMPRDPSGKFYVSHEQVPDADIPNAPFLLGQGYMLSRDIVGKFVRASVAWEQCQDGVPSWFRYMQNEDVIMGLTIHLRAPDVNPQTAPFCSILDSYMLQPRLRAAADKYYVGDSNRPVTMRQSLCFGAAHDFITASSLATDGNKIVESIRKCAQRKYVLQLKETMIKSLFYVHTFEPPLRLVEYFATALYSLMNEATNTSNALLPSAVLCIAAFQAGYPMDWYMLEALGMIKRDKGCNSIKETALLILQLSRESSFSTISPGMICSRLRNSDVMDCIPEISHSSKIHALHPNVCV